jgi:3-hydroxyisobutyrate dehydrogenase-like beta-hydroxyacid dehydrogenase
MAGRLHGAGHDLVVFDHAPDKLAPLARAGLRVARSVSEACADREAVISMVTDDAALRAIVADGMRAALPRGAVHAAMGTHGVAAIEEIAAEHAVNGQQFVAAPVFGRPEDAARGQLGIVRAGPADALATLAPLFAVLGRRTFEGGARPAGAAAMKLANNMILGCAIEAMGEGFALIRKHGVPPAAFYEILADGFLAAPAYKVYGNIIAREAYDQVGFPAALGLKDAGLILAAAQSAGVPLPSCNVYRDRLLGALAHGEDELDWAVIARDQARASGIE